MESTRIIVVRKDCPFCAKVLRAVNFINLRLPDLRRIRVIDNYEWEEFKFESHPIINQLPQDWINYPYIYIDGIEVEPSEIVDVMKICMGKIVEDDLTTPFQINNISIGG